MKVSAQRSSSRQSASSQNICNWLIFFMQGCWQQTELLLQCVTPIVLPSLQPTRLLDRGFSGFRPEIRKIGKDGKDGSPKPYFHQLFQFFGFFVFPILQCMPIPSPISDRRPENPSLAGGQGLKPNLTPGLATVQGSSWRLCNLSSVMMMQASRRTSYEPHCDPR